MLAEVPSPHGSAERFQGKAGLEVALFDLEKACDGRETLVGHLKEFSRQLDHILMRSGLLPHLKASLWSVYWMIHDPTEAKVSAFLVDAKVSMNREISVQGKRLLIALTDRLPQQPETVQIVIGLFLKLLAVDQAAISLTSRVLRVIGSLREVKLEMPPWVFERLAVLVPLRRLTELVKFTRHEDELVRQGALAFWEGLIDAMLPGGSYVAHTVDTSEWQRFRSLRFDWQLVLLLISDSDRKRRRQGITLLTLSDFPITDEIRRSELLNAMEKAQEEDELEAWARLLQAIPIAKSGEVAWRELLEVILAQPRTYSSAILTAAMERYTALVGEAGPHIVGHEVALGLPTAAAQGS